MHSSNSSKTDTNAQLDMNVNNAANFNDESITPSDAIDNCVEHYITHHSDSQRSAITTTVAVTSVSDNNNGYSLGRFNSQSKVSLKPALTKNYYLSTTQHHQQSSLDDAPSPVNQRASPPSSRHLYAAVIIVT